VFQGTAVSLSPIGVGGWRREGKTRIQNSEFGIRTNSHNWLYFKTKQEKVRILNSGFRFAQLAEWRKAETLKLPVFTGVPEDSAIRQSANEDLTSVTVICHLRTCFKLTFSNSDHRE